MAAGSDSAAPLDEQESAFWRALTRAMIVVPRALDNELIADQQLSMTEYVVLMHLSEATERRLRMTDLAAVCALSLSGMSRIVGRLSAAGLVQRVRDCADARGAFAVLTDEGFSRLEKAYPGHLASVRRHVFDHAGTADLGTFTDLLNRFGR